MTARPFVPFAIALALLVAAPLAHAATYIVPSDAEMIQTSDDIVVATAGASLAERDARGAIVTRYTLRIDEVLKGDRARGTEIVLTEQGGVLETGEAAFVGGAPRYLQGVRYLVFTTANRDFEPVTYGMSLGQFRLVEDTQDLLAIREEIHGFSRDNLDVHEERARSAKQFRDFIRAVAAGRYAEPDYFVEDAVRRQVAAERKVAANSFTRNSYLMQQGGVGFRWAFPTASWVRRGTQPGADGAAAIGVAFSQWNSTGAGIAYSDDGVDETATSGNDGKNAIIFNDPLGEVIAGAAGIGGASRAVGPVPISGESSYAIDEAYVVIAKMSLSQACLNAVMTHEIGHTLGFRHSNAKPEPQGVHVPCIGDATLDCTSDAIMNNSVTCSLASNLRPWDQTAAQTVYGSGPVCNPPVITAQPQSRSIGIGAATSLSVTVSGSSPITYQWHIGNPGDTSRPVTGGTTATINVSPSETTTYWVRVSNACSTAPVDSAGATVTVTCTPPSITAQPVGTTLTEGQSTQLQVVAAGSGLSYQWFIGDSGNPASVPTGSNSARLTVAPTETTKYWVRVSGICGSPVDSATATVTVLPCAEVTVDPPTATQLAGVGSFRLGVTAFSSLGPLTFQWFRGNTPGFGGVLVGSTQNVNVTVTAATSFWARVTNGCGKSAVTGLITVAPCTLPAITTQPQDQTIGNGGTATLSVAFTGAGATVTWYRGNVGDKSAPAGTGATITVGPLTQTTQFWAEVATSCGPVSSRAATITVEQSTTNLFLLNRRFNVQVRYRNQFANPPAEGLLIGRSLFASTLSDTAIFWFDNPQVVELMVRVSDARPFDNHFHIYLGGLSDVEFFITVRDTVTGESKEYHKPASSLVGAVDRATFEAPPLSTTPLDDGIDALIDRAVAPMVGTTADTSTLLMLGGRFQVRMRYRNQFASPVTEGYLLGRSIATSSTTDTAVFYFDNPESVEWMVRFLDVSPFGVNRIDFFHGGLSDVQYTVEVTDTKTGQRKDYAVAPFSLAGGVDRATFVP